MKRKIKDKISIQEILDYGFCSMYYKFKYIDKLSDANANIDFEYNEAIKNTIYGFLSACQCGDPGFTVIKNIWGRIWIKQKKVIDLIYEKPKSWRDSHNEKRKLGIYSLDNFYNFIIKEPNIPIVYNHDYEVSLNDITLIGKFEIIREVNKSIQLILIKNSTRNFNEIHLARDLEVTATSFAFRNIFEATEDSILLFNSEKGNFKKTIRTDNDYEILYNSVSNILKAINNDIYFACPSSKCFNCLYRKLCINSI